jgi:hypothetical protein
MVGPRTGTDRAGNPIPAVEPAARHNTKLKPGSYLSTDFCGLDAVSSYTAQRHTIRLMQWNGLEGSVEVLSSHFPTRNVADHGKPR